MSSRTRSIVEALAGVALAGAAIYVWAPRGQAAERLQLIAMAPAAAAAVKPALAKPGQVALTVFNDFQCPWCARLDSAVAAYASENANIHVEFRHRPLTSIHRHAFDAAVSAECARNAGQFDTYSHLLMRKQHLIGTKPWTAFAAEAGIADTARFSACLSSDADARQRVQRDLDASANLRTRGTPSLIIDGAEPNRQPSLDELRDLLNSRTGRD